jgi:CDP-glucose 4,6-dehydratase
MIDRAFWKDKRVFLTGHTGFKGSWLSLWLLDMGATVYGYSLPPPTDPSLFEVLGQGTVSVHKIGNIRDRTQLRNSLLDSHADVVIHMAAQALVRDSYAFPVETYETNIMGTVHLLDAVRACDSVRAVVIVTTDKCYENKEWIWGYRENESMGGYDPYSSSKACAELVTSAFRQSYFHPNEYGKKHNVAIATARAGNVIGGGDWAKDRLIPDILAAVMEPRPIQIRSPYAVRPWQHVLEPLSGYLTLAQALFERGGLFAESWNFGPDDKDARTVEWIVQKMCKLWKRNEGYTVDSNLQPHEAAYLKLDCSKSRQRLGWHPTWTLETALEKIVEWASAYSMAQGMSQVSLSQIQEFESAARDYREQL